MDKALHPNSILSQIILGLWLTGGAEAAITRTVSQDSAGSVCVTISWDLADRMESCLIVEERIPSGWRVVTSTNLSMPHVRKDVNRVQLATGIHPALSSAGSITYNLARRTASAPEELRFDGIARTMHHAQEVVMRVGGEQAYTVSETPECSFPVQANDFDGDWISDLAVFRPVGGQWSILNSEGEIWNLSFGWSAVTPVPADYDGDGQADLAVYHPASGNWYIRPSGGGGITPRRSAGAPPSRCRGITTGTGLQISPYFTRKRRGGISG